MVAPRRYGKTSLLRRVVEDARAEGWAAVYVDFFGVLTLRDVAERIESAYGQQLRGPLAKWFAGVRRRLRPTIRAGGGPVPASVDLTVDPQSEAPLLERLALPRRVHERDGTQVLVVFDEFQDVLATRDQADATIRSEIQHHADAASYVFAGSHVGMMRQLFSTKRRAFYGQTTAVDLGPLPPEDTAEYLAARFAATGRDIGEALDPLLGLAAGHPQRTMLLAHLLWEQVPHGGAGSEEAWLATYDTSLREVGDELRTIWTSLRTNQRRVLTAIAENTAPLYGSDRVHGGSRGGAVTAAARVLEERGEVVKDAQSASGFRMVDPLLAAWVREGRPGA